MSIHSLSKHYSFRIFVKNINFRLHGKVKLYDLDNPADQNSKITVPAPTVEGDRAQDPNMTAAEVFPDDTKRTTLPPNSRHEPLEKIHKTADIHITVWKDPNESDPQKERKWLVGVKGVDVKLVPMMNEFFSRTVTGSSWIQFSHFGMCD